VAASSQDSPVRLLTRHFLDHLIHNDLVSPDADRHAVLAVAVATICSVVLFVTMGLAMPYLVQFVQLPGVTAVSVLSDRALLFGGSMIVTALVTLLVWEHLAVEPRDSLILGHLPISTQTIVGAKLAALLQFVATFAVAVNLVPSLVYPTFMIANLRSLGLIDLLHLVVFHAATGLLAATFGFALVFAARGLLRLLLGTQWFGRASAAIHSTLTTVATVALLLLPLWAANVVRTELPPGGYPFDAPPMWFVGVNEAATGEVVVNAQLEVHKIRTAVTRLARIYDTDAQARRQYRSLQPVLGSLALVAIVVVPLVASLALATYYWTNRRLPLPVSWPVAAGWVRHLRARLLSTLAPANATARASFHFSLETLAGSAPHRLSIVIALALAVTGAVVTLYATGPALRESPSMPRGLIGAELIVTIALLLGFRHAVRVPAELPANWMIQLAWGGDRRAFIAGVKRSAMVLFVLPMAVASLAVNALFYDPTAVAAHLLCSVLGGWLLLDLTLLGYQKLPFTAALAPGRHVRVRGFFVFFGAVLGCRFFSTIEHRALNDMAALATVAGGLVAALIIVRLLDRRWRPPHPTEEFAPPPHPLLEVGLGDLVGRV
jgi:hypothetical protein